MSDPEESVKAVSSKKQRILTVVLFLAFVGIVATVSRLVYVRSKASPERSTQIKSSCPMKINEESSSYEEYTTEEEDFTVETDVSEAHGEETVHIQPLDTEKPGVKQDEAEAEDDHASREVGGSVSEEVMQPDMAGSIDEKGLEISDVPEVKEVTPPKDIAKSNITIRRRVKKRRKKEKPMSVELFNTAAEEVKNLTSRPSNDDLLKLYGLFKQAKEGDNNTPKPGMFDFKGSAKWKAWNELKGMTAEDARKQYIEFVEQLKAKQ